MCRCLPVSSTGIVSFCQAGHPYPMVIRDGNSGVEKIGSGCFPIGLMDEVSYEMTETRLHAGDLLILYSDGFCGDDTDELEDLLLRNGNLHGGQLQYLVRKWQEKKTLEDDSSAIFITIPL